MKKNLLIGFSLLLIVLVGCRKYDEISPSNTINLGVESKSTSIVSVINSEDIVSITYNLTVGSKYSLQVIPFGHESAIKTFGFTAETSSQSKMYDLTSLPKGDYDLILIDIRGHEIKRPIVLN